MMATALAPHFDCAPVDIDNACMVQAESRSLAQRLPRRTGPTVIPVPPEVAVATMITVMPASAMIAIAEMVSATAAAEIDGKTGIAGRGGACRCADAGDSQ